MAHPLPAVALEPTPAPAHQLVVLSSFGNLYLFCRDCQREERVDHELADAGVPAALVAAAIEGWEHTR